MPVGYGHEWTVVLWGVEGANIGWKHTLALICLYTVPTLAAGALYWRYGAKRKP